MEQLHSVIFINAMIFMVMGIWVTFLVSSNITNPLQEITRVLQEVRNGQFEVKAWPGLRHTVLVSIPARPWPPTSAARIVCPIS
jgi:hypothetical protein